jgi:hypothetical protein
MVNHFYQVVVIAWPSDDALLARTLGIAVSGSDGMDSILECVLQGARRLLLLCSFIPSI